MSTPTNKLMYNTSSFLWCVFLAACFFVSPTFSQSTPGKKGVLAPELNSQNNRFDIVQPTVRSQAAEDKMNDEIRRYRRTDTAPIIIPVVFHIVNKNPNSITNQQIIDALKDLNDAFSKSGNYSTSTGADTKIQFCLAQVDPEGGRTNGITRTTSFFADELNPTIEDARLKNLIQWDPARYVNIWYVKSIEQEVFQQFNCAKWSRTKIAGYATMPPAGGATDGIVVSGFKHLLTHEMGHYLGLYHTFEGFNCANNNCETDGDKVCDTPPDASVYSITNCTDPMNSCNSDTLSGYTIDMMDQTSNFMDYGNDLCQNQFTEGQAQRMRAAIATQRPGLLEPKCAPHCTEIITASFSRNNPYPVNGNTVVFTNTSTGATNFEWSVNGAVVSTATNYNHTFNNTGKYKITLKAFNSAACFSTTTDYVIVTCGVTARFYTDKTVIASQAPFYLDSIHFINTSENATSFKWIMSNDKGMAEHIFSTDFDPTFTFAVSANYKVRLIASNGSCIDTTLDFAITVIDPTADGVVALYNAECVDETKVRFSMYTCNNGYNTIPQNVPVTFYDADPQFAGAKKISTIFLTDSITGKCCSNFQTLTLDIGRRGLDKLFAVFNDDGSTSPLSLPNTAVPEQYYTNNITSISRVAFKDTAFPSAATLEWGDTLQLTVRAGPGVVTSYLWSTPKDLSCTSCKSPILIADTSIIKSVVATSNRGCTDTAYVEIKVPPYNDYRIKINEVQCAGTDSMYVDFTIYNDFKRAVLPKKLSVSFYNGDPLKGGSVLLGPLFILTDTIVAKQSNFTTFIKRMNAGNLYAVVNDAGLSVPITLPNTFLTEKDYTNNLTTFAYAPEKVSILPADTTVFRKQFVPLKINTTIYDLSSTKWTTNFTYNLNCINCISTTAQVFDSSLIKVETENRYGCLIEGVAAVNIFPPDMQVQITDTKCYSDNTALVTFTICMNNSFDSVFANIPVSFYDAVPGTGNARLLQSGFYTPSLQAGSCYTYTTRIPSPSSNKIVAVVNDKGNNKIVPATVYQETNYANNYNETIYTPFRVSINPSDTLIQRLSGITLTPKALGGTITSYTWKPAQFISCTDCPTPVVTPEYTTRYELLARNENFCTDTAIALVRTQSSSDVFIPDAFTPNNDRLNDVFYVIAGPEVTLLKEFAVFNRWGQKVFQSQNVAPNNPAFGWNGKVNGKEALPGGYVYYVNVSFANGTQQLFKGTLVLIR